MRQLVLFMALISSSLIWAQDTYLQCGSIIDTGAGTTLGNKTIVVSGNSIVRVEDGFVSGGPDDLVVDLKDRTVLPGLIDMHIHIESETSPKKYLEPFTLNEADFAFKSAQIANKTLLAGFTTVRDLGGSGVNVSLRNAVAKGLVPGPRIFTAEKAIGTTGGHADPTNGRNKELMGDPGPKEGVINGVEDARKAVRQRYKNGADWIKITATGGVLSVAKNGQNPQFTQEEINEIVSTAKAYGMKVAAHAHGVEGMQRAIKGGITTIEHGSLMDKETAGLMKQYGTYLVPTISAGRFVAEQAKVKGYYPEIIVPKALSIGSAIQDMFAMAYKEGVPIAFGTDAGVFPHGQNAKEFAYMLEAGMPVMESLKAATITNAKLLDMEGKLGALKEGYLADIIAVETDPTQDVSTLERVVFVMKDGHIHLME